MTKITRLNHFVPQALLSKWSSDGKSLWGYQTLVPDDRVPLWKNVTIAGSAVSSDLYTTIESSRELDTFERWLNRDFETPGFRAADIASEQRRLSREDWYSLIRLFAAQDKRTQLSYIEFSRLAEDLLDSAVKDCTRSLDERPMFDTTPLQTQADSPNFAEHLQFSILPPTGTDEATKEGLATLKVGRRLWLSFVAHSLRSNITALLSHKWSLARPHKNLEWPMTDNPTLRLNYYKPGTYDFYGGWASPGTELIFPISPQCLMYTQIQVKHPSRFEFPEDKTRIIQRLIAERAWRWVYTTTPQEWVKCARPREVDKQRFISEQEQWRHWHAAHTAAEYPEGLRPN